MISTPPNLNINKINAAIAGKEFKEFIPYVDSNYVIKDFHAYIISRLELFAEGKIKKLMVFMPPQHGKLCADFEPVITTNGWKKHGDLIPGDFVFGRDGRPVKVVALSKKMTAEYNVKFSDGTSVQCHGNHEWVVYDRWKQKERIVETKFLSSIKVRDGGEEKKRGNRNRFQVDWNIAIEFDRKTLPVHPYVFGAWLGDGSTGKNCITHHVDDNEVINKIIASGFSISSKHVHPNTGVITTYFKNLRAALKPTGAYISKHIPQEYLLSSREQRLELLAGLIDTDGYVYHKNGRITFSNINKRLINDVQQLVISLGWRTTVCQFQPVKSTSGIQGKSVVYQLCFNPDCEIPLAIERKKLKNFNPIKRKRGIVSVTKVVNPSMGNCIEVEGGVYLVGKTLIPTHNSQLTSRLFPAYILGRKPEKKIVIASYSATIAHEFARDVKNICVSPSYREVFPKTIIGKSKLIGTDGSYSDASYYYHTIPHKGFVYAVGRGGSITSKTVDIGIIDDPLKGRDEANSLTTKEKLWRWYNDDYRTRMHNESQEMLIQTRWAEDDLGGRLLLTEPDEWEVIVFPGIKTENYCAYDKRQPGEALWEEKHSLVRLRKIEKTNETSFNSLYQQDPKPNKKLLVHPDFVAVKEFPMDLINKWIIGYDYGMNDQTAVVAIGCLENKRYWKTLLYKPGRDIIAESKENVQESDIERVNGIIVEAIYQVIKFNNLLTASGYSEHDRAKILQLNGKGLQVFMANKSVSTGLEKVNEFYNFYLQTDLYLYNEWRTYQFKTIGEVILDVPIDGNDHIMNAGRYAINTDAILNNL